MSRRALVIYIQHFFIARMTYPSNRSYLSGNMENKNAIIAVVVAVIVVIAAVGAYYMLQNGEDDTPTEDSYYFYLKGFGEADGWYDAPGENGADAAMDALADSGLTFTIDGGWIAFEGYNGSYDAATNSGVGTGIYVYTSTDVAQPDATYFAAGPTMNTVTGNIIYITYSAYTMDPVTWATDYYENGPASNSDWSTTGPFAVDSDYQPIDYQDYSFYLCGFGDADGWYTASGANAEEAFLDAIADSGLTVSVDGGWISVEGYEGTYDSATNTGSGIGTYVYTSTDVSQPNASYFGTGPTLNTVEGSIMYITYSEYTMDPETWETTYLSGPAYTTDWMTTGPFAA